MEKTRSTIRLRRVIYVSGFLLSTLLLLSAFFLTETLILRLLMTAGAVFIPASAFAMDMVHKRYIDGLLIKLSELISTLINRKEEPIFSEIEDNLLSKLQAQMIKLTSILKAQNWAIESEKHEIQSLISDISHQLKTPIATVKMFGELLTEAELTEEERKDYCLILNQSLEKLTFLTESMIKMSKLESGIIQLKPIPVDLNLLILEAVKQIYYKAVNENVTLDFIPEGEKWITIDINWTREAIFNILDNAVKYSIPGATVRIQVLEYNIYYRIDIKDQGPGIEEKEQNKIFQRFYRGRGSEDKEGVGLGLYLARKVIVQENGYIKVSSDGKSGSTFSIFLPK
ncbi:MAG TPA: HAMP domain-containing histidine kinase [Clostridiales bacterium]|nr:HAMP domain-containing histidine kinase [Clostridiales bacterium]